MPRAILTCVSQTSGKAQVPHCTPWRRAQRHHQYEYASCRALHSAQEGAAWVPHAVCSELPAAAPVSATASCTVAPRRLCPGCTRRSSLNALLYSGGTLAAYQLAGTSLGKRVIDPLALSTIACKQPSLSIISHTRLGESTPAPEVAEAQLASQG